jgi:pimeloyl-ACP methyl ester carboxylesterase
VAAELTLRHPARVAALVVNGMNIFEPREAKFLRSQRYLPPVEVKNDGSHLFADWVKSRDLMTWFPWSQRRGKNRLPWQFPLPERIHDAFIDRLRAGNGYQALYGSVFRHDMRKAVRALTVPATFMAHASDILYPHLDRLPELKPNQRVVRERADPAAYSAAVAAVIRSHRAKAKAPPDAPFRPTPNSLNRRYVDLPFGQVLVRSAGETRGGRPLLLLHEGRGSSRVLEPLMAALARRRAVYAPDIPDNGASDPLIEQRPTIADYSAAIAATAAALRLKSCDIYALGAGATVALRLLRLPAFAKSRAFLEAPDFYAPAFARRLAKEWVPPIAPQWDGAHLNRLWLMLRDEYAFWPWFDKSATAACAIDAPDDWQELHARVKDIVRSLATYHRLSSAALRFDWQAALQRVRRENMIMGVAVNDPRRAHVEAAAGRFPGMHVVTLPVGAEAKAKILLTLLAG